MPAKDDIIKVLESTRDEDIDYSDNPSLDDYGTGLKAVSWPDPSFFKSVKLPLEPSPKHAITIKLDADLLRWLKSQGKGYQTRINALLRQYMEQQLQHQG